mgnify:CR=1 FL=1|tara:strand:- start:92 stop:280 length:189 start_codon:yes stop_codon:yes gene_type:complete
MFKIVKSWFKKEPGKKILKIKDRKYKQAVHFQRNGKLREYAEVMKEIEDLERKYAEVVSEAE